MSKPVLQVHARLNKERRDLETSYKEMFKLNVIDEDKLIWQITFEGASDTLYEKEVFTLQFKYSENYPFERPEVMFVGKPPVHEHIYSCGYICLNILDSDWSPDLKSSSVVLSILSMLSSATEKVGPPNDEEASARMVKKSPKDVIWVFNDRPV